MLDSGRNRNSDHGLRLLVAAISTRNGPLADVPALQFVVWQFELSSWLKPHSHSLPGQKSNCDVDTQNQSH